VLHLAVAARVRSVDHLHDVAHLTRKRCRQIQFSRPFSNFKYLAF
jgi:hypothetical protein